MGLFLRLCLARLGGSATFTLDSKEMETSDQLQLYVEGTDAGDGLTFVVHRVNEAEAGHA